MAKLKFKATKTLGMYSGNRLNLRDGDIIAELTDEQAKSLIATFPNNFEEVKEGGKALKTKGIENKGMKK